MLPPRSPLKKRRRRSVLLLLLINGVALLVLLILAELFLSYHDVPAEVRYSVFPPNTSTIVRVDPLVTRGVFGNAEFAVNAVGTRGPLPSADDDIRIVTIGGSTTECFVLSLDESWPYLLGLYLEEETGLRIWVGNIARAGRNSRQHYFDAKYVVPQFGRTDFAILLVGINDQFNRMIQGQAFEPVDVLALDEAGDYAGTALTISEFQGGWFERLHLVRRASRLLERMALLSPEQREIQHRLSHTLPDYYRNSRAMRRARGETLDRLPPMEEALEEFERNMRLIIARLRSNGTEPVLVSQPALWKEGMTEMEIGQLWLGSAEGWPPDREGGPYYSVEAMEEMLREYNETLGRIADSEGALFIDLASRVPQDLTTFYDDVHFNEEGSARVARVLAGRLLEDGFPDAFQGE